MKPRQIIVDGDTGFVPLTKGRFAIIDANDAHLIEGRNWCSSQVGRRTYAVTSRRNSEGRYTTVPMHRILFGLTDPSLMVDHIDGDGLNNRRMNLRVCTNSENGRNRGAQSNSASGVKGVWLDAKRGKWVAEVHVGGVRKFCRDFETLDAARAAYAEAAVKFHGQFARTS